MSTDITKFYQFLSSYGQNWTEKIDTEYGNDDGYVIRAEFEDFIEANWDDNKMGLKLTDDLISKFWNKMDTNKSVDNIEGSRIINNLNGLDDNEIDKMGKRIEAYELFNKYIETAVKNPSVLTTYGAEWRKDVIGDLSVYLEKWVDEGSQGDLAAYLEQFRPAIENKYTAQYCAMEYQNELVSSILSKYSEYKINDDTTLNEIINNYVGDISNNSAQADPQQIKSEIRSIIDAYFSTAGLCADSGYDLASLGYDPTDNSQLNYIQREVLTVKIRNCLTDLTSGDTYKENQELYDTEIANFINNMLDSTTFGQFSTVMNQSAADFKSSAAYKTLVNTLDATVLLKDVKEGSDYYNALKDTLGKELADLIAEDHNFLNDSYQNIINSAIQQVKDGADIFLSQNGFINPDAILDYVTSEIANAISDIYDGKDLSDLPVDSLVDLYKNWVDEADDIAANDRDDGINFLREHVILFLDALCAKGDNYKTAVQNAFSSKDYNDVINDCNTPSEINAYMELVLANIEDVVDPANLSLSGWSGVNSSYTLTLGGKLDLTPSVEIMNGSTPIDASRITYSASVVSGGGSVSINEDTGKMTVTGRTSEGSMKIEIYAMVDGVQVGEPKTITINCEFTLTSLFDQVAAWGGVSEHLEVYGAGNDGGQITGFSFADLYNNDAVIQLHHVKSVNAAKWGEQKGTVDSRLRELGGYIATALAGAGLDKDILDTAVYNVVNTLVSKGSTGIKIGNYWKNSDETKETANAIRSGNASYDNVIVAGTDYSGINETSYQISFKDFVDLILAEYEKLGGEYAISTAE